MALETVTYIDDLNEVNPTSTDPVKQGDDHIRNIKKALKNTFPNIDGAVNPTRTELNRLIGLTGNIQTQLDGKVHESLTVNAGSGLSGGGHLTAAVTLSHADTSSVPNHVNTDTKVIQSLSFDDFGHVTGIASKTLTPSNLGAMPSTESNQTGASIGYSQTFHQYPNNGTRTLNYTNGNYASVDRTGSLTINAPSYGLANSIILYIKNDGSATGSVTLSGFTKVTGDVFDNNSNSRWFVFCTLIRSNTHAHVVKIN